MATAPSETMAGATADESALAATKSQPAPSTSPPPPFVVYTRPQLVHLSKSPLVAPPPTMPDLKEWFGIEEQPHKRDPEPTTPNRERRFRRDQDDGESSSRTSFRSTLSQPSQMGNFKHHSLRGGDKEERDRDSTNLRNLSDKFDRDRLTIPLQGLRTKERDMPPHLAVSSSRNGGAQSQVTTLASRRAEAREGSKKKAGESSEDWRSKGRDERSENGRNDRARSRARDSSRPRRDPSNSRRDRDRDDKDRRRSDRDRDDHRDEEDDPRRWRDDGKRDERIAGRRDRERHRDKDKTSHDTNADPSSRWTVVEDSREARPKRNGREKRTHEDGRDKEERRERERDKQPAWMDTYIPGKEDSGSVGILGGQGAEGELDGIQAWKKGVQEKEQKDKAKTTATTTAAPSTVNLDEIQMFRLMMEKEQHKDDAPVKSSDIDASVPPKAKVAISEKSDVSAHDNQSSSSLSSVARPTGKTIPSVMPIPESKVATEAPDPRSLLSLLATDAPAKPAGEAAPEASAASTSRFFPRPLTQGKPAQSGPAPIRIASPGLAHEASGSRTSSGRVLSTPINPLELSGSPRPFTNGTVPSHEIHASNFPLFEEHRLPAVNRPPAHDEFNPINDLRRASDRVSPLPAGEYGNMTNDGFKGSRFAKYFDGKAKDHAARGNLQTPIGMAPGRSEAGTPRSNHQPGDQLAMDDLVSMLNNSTQHPRIGHAASAAGLNAGHQGHMSSNLLNFQHPQTAANPPPLLSSHHQLLGDSRFESLYDSRNEDRSFVPDGMVPGLRTAPPPRDRLYAEAMEDTRYNNHRLPAHQRSVDPMLSNPGGFPHVQARNVNVPVIQQQYRGGPSPGLNPPLQSHGQRLPPGLANLGGRPPHEPSPMLGVQGLQSGNLHGIPSSLGQQLQFNSHSFGGGGIRGPSAASHHLPSGPLQNPMLSNPNHVDLRLASQQQQLLAMANSNSNGGRGLSSGYGLQQGVLPQSHAMRQSQLPQVHPQMMPHQGHPGHQGPSLTQQHGMGMNNQPAQDLMALLMGGPPRD